MIGKLWLIRGDSDIVNLSLTFARKPLETLIPCYSVSHKDLFIYLLTYFFGNVDEQR